MSRRRKIRKILFYIYVLLIFFFNRGVAAQDVLDKTETPPGKAAVGVAENQQSAASQDKKDNGYIYDPTGKTDPFKSFIALQEEMEEKLKRKPRTYLETVDLSQLELTAIVTSQKENWAMVRDSKGLGHVIRKGTYIGTNGGVVHEIKKKEVIIREQFKDFRGNIRHKDISKALPSLL
jgi:Tfp pilus assembly protein PilP